MLTLINTAHFGITQFFPGVIAIIFVRNVSPRAIMAGIIAADILALALYLENINLGGWNVGFLCLFVNIAIIVTGTALARGSRKLTPVSQQSLV